MKIITIGDLHGRLHRLNTILSRINWETTDKVVFIGDYVDEFVLPDHDIIKTLKTVIRLKQEQPDKVVLLLGNHDAMYMWYGRSDVMCSGFRRSIQSELTGIFQDHARLFQIAFPCGNTLWTHAGVSPYYLDRLEKESALRFATANQISTELNYLYRRGAHSDIASLVKAGHDRGAHGYGGVLWCGKDTLINAWCGSPDFQDHPVKVMKQIVGHTNAKSIEHYGNLWFVDCLHHCDDVLTTHILETT